MKEKPWQERLVPGVFFQFHQELQPWTGIDVSPYIGYRLSGRFRTFIGGTYRLYAKVQELDVNTRDRAYSFRWFSQVKIINGFYVHLEVERKMEDLTSAPPQLRQAESKLNIWENHYHAGLMRLQRINKRVNGTFYALYDFEHYGSTFNVRQVTTRFGLEYKLKKKKKSSNAIGDSK